MNPDLSFGPDAAGPPAGGAATSIPHVEHARSYVERDWAVLPLWWPTLSGDCACGLPDCESTGRHPIRRLVPHGLHDASSRADAVESWWRQYPDANVGIRTGAGSGPVVLAIHGQAGRLALRGLIAHHGRFEAVWVRTGSGGWHAYLAHPGVPVPGFTSRLGVGLDVRGDGGYVVAPPSRHRSGRRSRWVGAASELPPMPRWLLKLASTEREPDEAAPLWLLREDVHTYAAAALVSEAREVAEAPVSQRGQRLNLAAVRLGQLAGAGLIAESTITDALVAAGLAAGADVRKTRFVVRRGVRTGALQPRQVVVCSRAEVPPC